MSSTFFIRALLKITSMQSKQFGRQKTEVLDRFTGNIPYSGDRYSLFGRAKSITPLNRYIGLFSFCILEILN